MRGKNSFEKKNDRNVHPTWAGTFVLAALVAVFSGLLCYLILQWISVCVLLLKIILVFLTCKTNSKLDSNCLPVTLFEVEDLWTEAFLARFPAHFDGGTPKEHPLHACQRFRSDPKVQYTQHRVSEPSQGTFFPCMMVSHHSRGDT